MFFKRVKMVALSPMSVILYAQYCGSATHDAIPYAQHSGGFAH